MMNFDEILNMVGERNGVNEWYEVFDSDLFDEMLDEIARRAGITWDDDDDLFDLVDQHVDGFAQWYGDMAEDL